MSTYHRTQVLLEEWQYGTLKRMAEGEGVSLSGMLRQILTSHLRPPPSPRSGLQAIAGIGRDSEASGKAHDRWLYGQERHGGGPGFPLSRE